MDLLDSLIPILKISSSTAIFLKLINRSSISWFSVNNVFLFSTNGMNKYIYARTAAIITRINTRKNAFTSFLFVFLFSMSYPP